MNILQLLSLPNLENSLAEAEERMYWQGQVPADAVEQTALVTKLFIGSGEDVCL